MPKSEALSRYAKAIRLADFIEARRVADQAPTYSEKERAEIAMQAAERRAPSDETWELVLAILRDRAQARTHRPLPAIDRASAVRGFVE